MARDAVMIAALLRKELRQLAPLAAALMALWVWHIGDQLLLHPPDSSDWWDLSWLVSPQPVVLGLSQLLVGLLVAWNLMPGEHDQRTIELLYTLPVRRRTILLVKFAAGVTVLAGVSLVGQIVELVQLALAAESFARRQLSPSRLALELGLDVAMAAMCVAYGVLLSFFRGIGWMLAVVAWLALELGARLHPPLAIFSVTALGRVEHHGTVPLIPWKAWGLHAAMASVALAAGARLWLGRGETFAAFERRLRARPRLRAAGVAVSLIALIAIVGIMVAPSLRQAADAAGAPAGGSLRHLRTRHFQLTYLDRSEAQAQLLSREADRALERVRAALGAPPIDTVIADLTAEGTEYRGLAGWRKVRMDLRPSRSEEQLRFTLYHEVTHVAAAAISEGIAEARDAELRFFGEGLAQHVAYELVPDPRDRAAMRRLAAAAAERFRLQFDDLLAPEAFVAQHDEWLLYALGEVWVDALVETCGAATRARVLEVMARKSTPQALSGRPLWRHALRVEGCDLDRVLAQHQRRLVELAPAARKLPVATATLVAADDDTLTFEIRVRSAGASPVGVVLRVRETARTPFAAARSAEDTMIPGAVLRLDVERPPLAGNTLQYMVGASDAVARTDAEAGAGPGPGADADAGRRGDTGDAAPPFFSRWQSTSLPP